MNQQWGQPGGGYRPAPSPRPGPDLGRVVIYLVFGVVALFGGAALIGLGRGALLLRVGELLVCAALVAIFCVGRFVASAPPTLRRVSDPGVALLLSAGFFICCGLLGFAGHASDVKECDATVTKFGSLTGVEEASPSDARAKLDSWTADATEGARVCDLAGMTAKADVLRDVLKEVDRQRSAIASSATRTIPTSTPTATIAKGGLDPSTCPKGSALVDTTTGDLVQCTGPADESQISEWLDAFGKITHDPKSRKPKSTSKTSDGDIEYTYDVAPFRSVTMTVLDGVPAHWSLGFKTIDNVAGQLSPKGTITRLCERGIATWYEVDDGPLAGSYVSVGERDSDGMIDINITSGAEMLAEKAREEANGAPRAASIRDQLCPN